MKFFQILLFPFSIIYGLLLLVRNKLYEWKILRSTEFSIPVISVGNLSAGGTGKTPHIEYLIRLLSPELNVATLSRGYGRKTTGFLLADKKSNAADIGDEPLQFATKFDKIIVAVDEKRVHGIEKLLADFPSLQAVLLDDAFQHRAVKSGLSIVLTDYNNLYYNDFLLPTGTLREFRSGIKRADVIIISKCPLTLLSDDQQQIINEINPSAHQAVYFSSIKYGEFIPLTCQNRNPLSKELCFDGNYSILLLTGIANTSPLEHYLKDKVKALVPVKFPDHHSFTKNDLLTVKKIFDNIAPANKIILTTEKDAMRLKSSEFSALLEKLPLFYMPIEIDFYEKNKNDLTNKRVGQEFNKQILNYVRTNQKHSNIYSK